MWHYVPTHFRKTIDSINPDIKLNEKSSLNSFIQTFDEEPCLLLVWLLFWFPEATTKPAIRCQVGGHTYKHEDTQTEITPIKDSPSASVKY